MSQTFKGYSRILIICVLATLPMAVLAGGTPEDVKTFKENKAKAEAGEGFINYWDGKSNSSLLDFAGKAASEDKITPGALVANAYLSGIGVDRDEETALLWYFRVKGQKGLNEEGFKALIRSMPGQKVFALNQRRSEEIRNNYKKQEQAPRVLDQVFKPAWDLRSSSSESGNSFGMNGPETFIWEASFARSRRLILEEFVRSKGADELQDAAVSCMEHFEFKPFSARVAFMRDVTEDDRALYLAATELIKAKLASLISNPSGADSRSLELVASAYGQGRFGLKADPEQNKRWEELARKARISEAKARVSEADSSGPEVWLQLAYEMKWASPDVKNVLSKDRDWASRYVEVLTIKAEAGDLASLDGLVSFYGARVMAPDGLPRQNAIHESSYNRDQLFKWISERHKFTRNPEDAIILAHHYQEIGKADLSMRMVNQYLTGLTAKAKQGSLPDFFKVALLSDPEWYEALGGDLLGHSKGDDGALLSRANLTEFFSFRQHGRLLMQHRKVGSIVSSMMQEGYTLEQLNDPKFVMPEPVVLVPRSLYLKYVEEFKKQERSGEGLRVGSEDLECFIFAISYLARHDETIASQYAEIKGGTKDHGASLRWLRDLAELGDHESLMLMAAAFEHGRGVPLDSASAYAYYAFAGSGPGNGPFPSESYQKTQGTNEQKLDACFKLSPADKERALKIYNELTSKLVERFNRLAAKGGEEMAKRDLQAIRDYQAQKSGKAKAVNK